jgi:replicative DNA helicase
MKGPPAPTPLREEPALSRPPLVSAEAEQGLLGALLISNAAYERVAEFLRPEHFGLGVHGRIYAAIGKLIDDGSVADPVKLAPLFDRDEALSTSGRSRYLATLVTSAVTVINAVDYGRTIHDLYLRRELAAIGQDVIDEAHRIDLDDTGPAQIARTEAKLFALATAGQVSAGFRSFREVLARAIAEAEAAYKTGAPVVGVPTGLADLDRLLGGLHKSDLIVIGGRPGMGKSALGVNIAYRAAATGCPAGVFSLEMSGEQLAARILGEVSGIGADRIRRSELGADDFADFLAIGRQLGELALWIDDTPAADVAALRARARRLKRRHGLDLIVIDYIQLLHSAGDTRGRRPENRVQEISDITRGLKAMAKELELPVLAISQLSRAVEQREDKRPLLADLRESGSIEQDADVVMFLFREEYYLREPDPADTREWNEWRDRIAMVGNKGELNVAKNRHGPLGTIHLRWDHRTTRFDNLAQ